MKTKNTDLISQNKVFGLIALVTGVILSIPFIAMQFTNDVNWILSDFVIIGVLLFTMGSLFVVVARVMPKKYRTLIGIGFVLTVLYIWTELAVGVFTNIGS